MFIPFDNLDSSYVLDFPTSSLYTLNLVTGVRNHVLQFPAFFHGKSFAYNDLDQYLYLYDNTLKSLLRFSADGQFSQLSVKDLPNQNFSCVTIDIHGTLYLYQPHDTCLYTISLNETLPDFLTTRILPIAPLHLTHWCIHPQNNYLYSLDEDGTVLQIIPQSGAITRLHTVGLKPLIHYQMLFDFDGILYLIDSNESTVYRVLFQDGHAYGEIFSHLVDDYKDAVITRCTLSPLLVKLGTAPAPYTTHISQNGPRHLYNQLLYLLPLTLPTANLLSSNYSFNLSICNQTGKPAYLYVFADWHQKGYFPNIHTIEPIVIPSCFNEIQNILLTLRLPPDSPIPLGQSYLRLRLTTDHLFHQNTIPFGVDSRSLGAASDGDILDLPIYVDAPPPVSSGSLYLQTFVDETLTGTVQASDPCEGHLLYALEQEPLHGKVILESTGHFSYIPLNDNTLEDYFTICATSSISHLTCSIPIHIQIDYHQLDITCSCSHRETIPDLPIMYTISIHNTGTLSIEHLILISELPLSLEPVPHSVCINGVQDLTSLPHVGINLLKLHPDGKCLITFSARLTDSMVDTVSLCCKVQGTYGISPQGNPRTFMQEIHSPLCKVQHEKLDITLSAHTDTCFLDEPIQYTLILNNTGTLVLENIHLTLLLPTEMYYKGDFTLDYSEAPIHLVDGYTLSKLSPSESHKIQFKTIVTTSPQSPTLSTFILASYQYTLNDHTQFIDENKYSHTLSICQPKFSLTKKASQPTLSLGESFTYFLEAKNQSQLPLKEVIIQESVPTYLEVTNISEGIRKISNTLHSGISLGDLSPFASKNISIDLKVLSPPPNDKVLSYPTTGIFKVDSLLGEKIFYEKASEKESVLLNYPQLTLEKSSDTVEYTIDDTIHYTVIITNTGTIPLIDIKLTDLLTPELSFIQGSILVDGKSLPDSSIISGIPFKLLECGEVHQVQFDARILKSSKKILETTSTAYYAYNPYHKKALKLGTVYSNLHQIHLCHPDISVSGSIDTKLAYLNDVLLCTFILNNSGDVDASNVIVKCIPSCADLVDGTFSVNTFIINGITLNEPLHIGKLLKGESTQITFQIKVSHPLQHQNNVSLQMYVEFLYTTTDHNAKTHYCPPLKLFAPLALSTFKELSLEHTLELYPDKPDFSTLSLLTGHIQILSHYIIDTPKGTSQDGLILTGSKLIIHGLCELTAEYASSELDSSLCTVHYLLPFSTFIITPETSSPTLQIDTDIQHIAYKLLNNRMFYANISLLIVAKF